MASTSLVLRLLAYFVLFAPYLVSGATVTYNWHIGWVEANPDGELSRPVVAINGQFPLPMVEINLGDTFVANIYNGLGNETTSIHWHGLHQTGTDAQDGPPGVAQCEIPPGASYTYSFTPDQVGSYWYHTHSTGQLGDGLRGPFIIKDPNSPYAHQYSEELVVTVSDWYHDQAPALIPVYLSPTENPDGAEPVPYTALIGEGINTQYQVKPCTGYLVRLINIGAFAQSYIQFDQHEMTIIAVDGVYVEPRQVQTVYITVAQRYDVLIQTKCSTNKNYAFISSFDENAFDDTPSYLQPNATGYLVYNHRAPLPEMPNVPVWHTTDDFTLVPYDHEPLLTGPADQEITLDITFFQQDNQNLAGFNDIPYIRQKVPTLYTALTTGHDAMNPVVYGANAHPFVLNYNDIIEVTINNYDNGIHPIHIHGHQPQIVERVANVFPYNGGSVEKRGHRHKQRSSRTSVVVHDTIEERQAPNPTPMRRDTWVVPILGYVKIRFQANNPGIWLMHCHMEWHITAGMTATFIEAPLQIQQQQTIPASMEAICKSEGVPTSGNAAGNTKNFLDLNGAPTTPTVPNLGAYV